jgi:hypothetical protein
MLDLIRTRTVTVGMSAGEVLQSWGQPTKINRSTFAWGTSEQWIYRYGPIQNTRYIYLDNDRVVAIQGPDD